MDDELPSVESVIVTGDRNVASASAVPCVPVADVSFSEAGVEVVVNASPACRGESNMRRYSDGKIGATEYSRKEGADSRFTIHFAAVIDVPSCSVPFLRAYISDGSRAEDGRYARISEYVTTPKRPYAKTIVWNCFRNFRILPTEKCILHLELYDDDLTNSRDDAMKDPIGTKSISIGDHLMNENHRLFRLDAYKVSPDHPL
jgi:hypothetical protein